MNCLLDVTNCLQNATQQKFYGRIKTVYMLALYIVLITKGLSELQAVG